MLLTCPHCHSPNELDPPPRDQELVCPSCGSSFRLEAGETTSYNPGESLRMLGKFEILNTLGVGAFGTDYRARDAELDRIVAIKVPRADAVGSGDHLERLVREARAVAQLRHPNIVPVHEVGQHDGLPYLVSEFVQGVTLADWLTGHQPTAREAAELVGQIAVALQYAHERGVIHRDIKPSNIMMDDKGTPYVMDFGLAKRAGGELSITVDGQILGTPAYMSPEQASGEARRVDGRSDVYSIGVILYRMLTGQLPFRGNARILLHQVINDEPRLPRSLNKHIPRDLETICLHAMAKAPARRYATAQDFADDIRRYLNNEPIRAKRPTLIERIQKSAQRHRGVALTAFVGLSVAIVASLVTGYWASGHNAAPSPSPVPFGELSPEATQRARDDFLNSFKKYQTIAPLLRDFYLYDNTDQRGKDWAENGLGREVYDKATNKWDEMTFAIQLGAIERGIQKKLPPPMGELPTTLESAYPYATLLSALHKIRNTLLKAAAQGPENPGDPKGKRYIRGLAESVWKRKTAEDPEFKTKWPKLLAEFGEKATKIGNMYESIFPIRIGDKIYTYEEVYAEGRKRRTEKAEEESVEKARDSK